MPLLSEKLDSNHATDVEPVTICALCESRESTFLFWNFDRLYLQSGKFGTYSCDRCGLIWISPRPTLESIGRHYPPDYGSYNQPDSIHAVSPNNKTGIRGGVRTSVLSGLGYHTDQLALWQRILRPILTPLFFHRATYGYDDLFPDFVENGHALDIGCGNGAFLSFLKYHGWMVSGIDLSPFAAKQAKELFDIDVFTGQLQSAPFEPSSFDFIRLSHVLEHFFDPVDSLRTAYSWLKPGGVIYVEVPNARGAGAQIAKEYWFGWDAPRHLFMFTPETLQRALLNTGFGVRKIRTALWDAYDWAETFAEEDARGERLSEPPSVSDSGKEAVERNRERAARAFAADKTLGDFINCWAVKPLS